MGSSARPVDITVPGDKSISHRALLLAALATGESRISGLLDAADTRATAAALRDLGFAVPAELTGEIRVRGAGLDGIRPRGLEIDCANSGTTARLLLGLLAGCDAEAVLTGDASLRRRPMRRVTEPLADAGARYDELGESGRLPIGVRGRSPLAPIRAANPRSSAQVKSALLLAGLTGHARVDVTSPLPSRDHTERMLLAMGATVETWRSHAGTLEEAGHPGGGKAGRAHGVREAAGERVASAPVDLLSPVDLTVPGDISAAAFFLGLAALAGRPVRITGVGLNPGRIGVLEVLRAMGARIEATQTRVSAGEPVGDVEAAPGDGLRGVRVAPDRIPSLIDEVPVLAVVAARAEGATRFEGVAELRVKESDRVAALCGNLRALGVEAEEEEDAFTVIGRPGARLIGEVEARGDHRIAMAFGILGAARGNDITVSGADSVSISYPGFWRALERVRRQLEAH